MYVYIIYILIYKYIFQFIIKKIVIRALSVTLLIMRLISLDIATVLSIPSRILSSAESGSVMAISTSNTSTLTLRCALHSQRVHWRFARSKPLYCVIFVRNSSRGGGIVLSCYIPNDLLNCRYVPKVCVCECRGCYCCCTELKTKYLSWIYFCLKNTWSQITFIWLFVICANCITCKYRILECKHSQ